jgi:hypothetical protein
MKKYFNTRSFISFITLAQGPEFEVYTGITIPNVDNGNIGHIIGLNVTPNLYQTDKYNPNKNREYLNKLSLGIEYSGYQTKSNTLVVEKVQ